MSRVILSPLAGEDLEDIHRFISQDSPSAALSVIASIEDTLALLAEWPRMGRSRPELTPDCRSVPVHSYIIYYRPRADGIEVGRILHGARDPRIAFGP